MFGGRFEIAEEYSGQGVDLDPSAILARWGLGIALVGQGRLDEGIAELTACERGWGGLPILGWLGYAHGLASQRPLAEAVLERIDQMPAERVARSTEIARVLIGLGEHDRALDALADACRGHETALGYIARGPCWD